MRLVGVLEAKTNFSALITEVEEGGEEIVVTRHGKPVARILRARPLPKVDRVARAKLIDDIVRTGEEIAARHPDAKPFDIDEALDRDRNDRWS